MPSVPQTPGCTIASGATTSNSVDLKGQKIVSVRVPTIDSGTFTIECSDDGSTWVNMKDTNGTVIGQWTTSTGGFMCDGDVCARFMGVNYIRFVCEATQTETRTIKVVVAQE
jgi:hypothetical protein